ncbi:MAG: MBL fold metallo-hydrolase [Methanomicrobium sp.]|nr:MBL fold metallo-hydrolase [Methanomicrobium sp.]
MPHGSSNPVISGEWQPVPGAPGIRIFPYIRKCDTISSNSYILDTPDAICLTDPGGLSDQVKLLFEKIDELREEKKRPLIIFLTHAHIDHFIAVQELSLAHYFSDTVFAVQERGFESLEKGDNLLTQGKLLGKRVMPMKAGLSLLPARDNKDSTNPVFLSACKSTGAKITRIYTKNPDEEPFYEKISFSGCPVMKIYHTPGHSPDSICIQTGRLLMTGDVLFAANPGIAGMYGWSQKDLVKSLEKIKCIIKDENIEWILPGHGRAISAPEALTALEILEKKAQVLENIAEFNAERAAEVALFAGLCMEELNELFTIISGRLFFVIHIIEELGEECAAKELRGIVNCDAVDEILEAFSEFSKEHHNKNSVPAHLALKAGQVVGKLENSFEKDSLGNIIDPTLVARAQHLLSDYTTMFRGFCPPENRCECDLNSIISERISTLSKSRFSDDDLFSSVEDEDAFIRMLAARIGSQPLLADTNVEMLLYEEECRIIADTETLFDVVVYIIEDLVGSDAEKIVIATEKKDSLAVLKITGERESSDFMESAEIKKILYRLSERSGGKLCVQKLSKEKIYRISFDSLN